MLKSAHFLVRLSFTNIIFVLGVLILIIVNVVVVVFVNISIEI